MSFWRSLRYIYNMYQWYRRYRKMGRLKSAYAGIRCELEERAFQRKHSNGNG
jgi:hypothetical protein